MNPSLCDVLVIGAGPVGLALAAELKRHGANVRIVEKKSHPIEHPNAAIVHVRTLEILKAMGAVEGFLQEGYELPGIHVSAFGKRIGFIDVGAGVDSPYPVPRTISQVATERLLNEHLAGLGVKIERQVEALDLMQDATSVRVRVRHLAAENREEMIEARWVVGCEGSASMTRKAAGIPFEGERYSGKQFLQTDATVRWSYPHGYGYQFMTRDYILMLFPYNDRGHYRIICACDDPNPEDQDPPSLDEMQHLVRTVADSTAELYDPEWFNKFRTGHRFASTFRQGRVFIAGDAGHVHIPIGGQGMNYGIHDAFNLGWKLAAVVRGEAPESLLDSYMAERHAADGALIQGTDRGFHALVKPKPALRKALELFGSTLLGVEALQKRIRRTLAEVDVAYPKSPLSEDHGGSRKPSAGDRAPDAQLVKMPERETIQLFDIMAVTAWHALLFSGTEPTLDTIEKLEAIGLQLSGRYRMRVRVHLILSGAPLAPLRENRVSNLLADWEQYAHSHYGVGAQACLYLIRPDWYVGFRGTAEHSDQMFKYLERVLISK